ncbi:hypothetical protein [Cohnella silvisoli]|uniref:Uncharacterized protein n=1 Tax=Cohnella silvisoli TaxID=2873699 RepID=A0ABV1KYT6_9BACL|nr:hypothetical protein [Cohnella silvisoli]MCD9024353.1 hypothetical protein [Cohnella silvisoli]
MYESSVDTEITESLRTSIGCYVEDCAERGSTPDAFAFSLTYQRDYGRVPGAVIERLINEELTKYGRKNFE